VTAGGSVVFSGYSGVLYTSTGTLVSSTFYRYSRFFKDFKVHTTEEFKEHCQDGALSIEVWGHKSQGFNLSDRTVDNVNVRSRSLSERYVCRSDSKQK
jgi:hypothetical protein